MAEEIGLRKLGEREIGNCHQNENREEKERQRAEADGREVRYGTAPRFLQVFGLGGLDELPRLGDTQPV